MDTIETTAADTVQLTATLRPARDLPAGAYRLRTGVIELAVCLLRRPVLRGRVEAAGGTLTVGELSMLELDLLPDTLRAGVPFVRGRLLPDLDTPLALRARSVHTDEDTVVLTASGPLPKRFLRVTLAAEFVR
jgi:hypothetical protein